MLDRIARELFWLGRNLARAEHTARMLDGVFATTPRGRPDDPAGVTLNWGRCWPSWARRQARVTSSATTSFAR